MNPGFMNVILLSTKGRIMRIPIKTILILGINHTAERPIFLKFEYERKIS